METLTTYSAGGAAAEPYSPYHVPAPLSKVISAEIAAERHNREAAAARRVLRAARPSTSEVVYEITSDPGYLKQYYILRERMYINVWGLKSFDGNEDEYDAVSDIIVARIGRQVIGGIRLTVSSPDEPRVLSMEADHFRLARLFPALDLEHTGYAEFSRFAVLPEFQTDVTFGICSLAYQRVIEKKIPYCFAMGPHIQMRNNRRVSSALGVPSRICTEIEVTPKDGYEGRMSLIQFDLTTLISDASEHKWEAAEHKELV